MCAVARKVVGGVMKEDAHEWNEAVEGPRVVRQRAVVVGQQPVLEAVHVVPLAELHAADEEICKTG